MSSTEQVPGVGNDDTNRPPKQNPEDVAVLMSPEDISEMLKLPSESKRKRRIGIAAAATAVATTAAILVATGALESKSPDKPAVEVSDNNRSAAGQPNAGIPSTETKRIEQEPVRGSLCNIINLEQLLRWTGEKAPQGYSPEKATCVAEQTNKTLGLAMRAHARWSWDNLPAGERTLLGSVEVAVYDEQQADGSSAFSKLMTTYAPARSRPMKAGEHPVTVASANGSTVVNVPESDIDLTMTTRLSLDKKPNADLSPAHRKLEAAQVAALPQLVPAIVNG